MPKAKKTPEPTPESNEADLSIQRSVTNEAKAVERLASNRQPLISTMSDGTTRIDF